MMGVPLVFITVPNWSTQDQDSGSGRPPGAPPREVNRRILLDLIRGRKPRLLHIRAHDRLGVDIDVHRRLTYLLLNDSGSMR